jgi:hypothetical protein
MSKNLKDYKSQGLNQSNQSNQIRATTETQMASIEGEDDDEKECKVKAVKKEETKTRMFRAFFS